MNGSLLNGIDLFNLCLSQGTVPHWNIVLKYWPYNCAVVMKKLVIWKRDRKTDTVRQRHRHREAVRETWCAVSLAQTACCTTPNSPIPRVLSTVIESSLMTHRQTDPSLSAPLPASAAFFTSICHHHGTQRHITDSSIASLRSILHYHLSSQRHTTTHN